MNATVRIVGVPSGEAPLWVREKWVGLELPLADDASPAAGFTFGVLSAPRTWLDRLRAIARGKAVRASGFVVEGDRAIDILEKASPEAAAWWREHAPHVRGSYLLFHDDVCERIGL